MRQLRGNSEASRGVITTEDLYDNSEDLYDNSEDLYDSFAIPLRLLGVHFWEKKISADYYLSVARPYPHSRGGPAPLMARGPTSNQTHPHYKLNLSRRENRMYTAKTYTIMRHTHSKRYTFSLRESLIHSKLYSAIC